MNNIVNLNLNSTKNSYNIKTSTVNKINIKPNLIDATDTNQSVQKTQEDVFSNLDLREEEYSFEELMKYAEERSLEIDKQKAEEAKRKAEEAARKKAEAQKKEKEKDTPWWKSVWDYGVTAVASVTTGVLEVAENIVDGVVMAGGAVASGVVSIWDEEAADRIKQKTSEIVSYDATGKIYDTIVDAAGVDEDVAYGKLHQYASAAGTMVGYAALSMVPGGTAVAAAAGGLAAMGSASENALNSGATFEEALVVGTVAGISGAATGGALNKVGKAAKGATSLLQVTGYTASGAGIAATEPVINSVVEYATYGNDSYDNYWDYYVESGAALNTIIAGGAGGLSTGTKGARSYKQVQDLVKNKGYSIELENSYKDSLKKNNYKLEKNVDTRLERRKAYSNWYDECQTSGWTTDMNKRFESMGNASITLDSDGVIDAKRFWQLKGDKSLRVENPTYSAKQMNNLENIRKSGTVDIYLTEDQYKQFKLGNYEKGIPFDGRIDSDGHTRAYCTKLESSSTSSKELGEILGTGWEDGKKLYHGTLNSSGISYSSGLEASANADWIPGGYTLNINNINGLGVPDLVVKDYKLDPKNYMPVN